jgi:hypothetical protein
VAGMIAAAGDEQAPSADAATAHSSYSCLTKLSMNSRDLGSTKPIAAAAGGAGAIEAKGARGARGIACSATPQIVSGLHCALPYGSLAQKCNHRRATGRH